MPYRVITDVRFTDQFMKLTEEERNAEQLAAFEIVGRNGGTIQSIHVIPADRVAVTIAEYPDERASVKAHLQIEARGAYTLDAKRTYTLDEWMVIAQEANEEALLDV